MRKSLTRLMLLVILVITSTAFTVAAEPEPNSEYRFTENAGYYVTDNTKYKMESSAKIYNGSMYIPLSAAAEVFDTATEWDSESGVATIVKGEILINIFNDCIIYYDTASHFLDKARHRIDNGIVMIPLRAISEILGYTVEFDDKTNTASIRLDSFDEMPIRVIEVTNDTIKVKVDLEKSKQYEFTSIWMMKQYQRNPLSNAFDTSESEPVVHGNLENGIYEFDKLKSNSNYVFKFTVDDWKQSIQVYTNGDNNEPPRYFETTHFKLWLAKDLCVNVTDEQMTWFMDELEKAYDFYVDFYGKAPLSTPKIGITVTRRGEIPSSSPASAIASPEFNGIVIQETELEKIPDKMAGKYGLFEPVKHEISHLFGHKANYIFDVETDADFTSAIANKKFGIQLTGNYFVGDGDGYENIADPANHDYFIATGTYEDYIAHKYKVSFQKDEYDYQGIVYLLLKIHDKVGSEPFKQVYRYFSEKDRYRPQIMGHEDTNFYYSRLLPASKIDIFELYINKLCEFSGVNVWEMFTEQDLEVIATEYCYNGDYLKDKYAF